MHAACAEPTSIGYIGFIFVKLIAGRRGGAQISVRPLASGRVADAGRRAPRISLAIVLALAAASCRRDRFCRRDNSESNDVLDKIDGGAERFLRKMRVTLGRTRVQVTEQPLHHIK